MITEVYFIEGLYLYTLVGSSSRGVLASHEHGSQVPLAVPVCVSEEHSREVRRRTYWWWIFKVNSQVRYFKVKDANGTVKDGVVRFTIIQTKCSVTKEQLYANLWHWCFEHTLCASLT